jgi:hypothetical protein
MKDVDGRDMLLFVSSVDTKGRKDASGAFVPEARGFAKENGIPESNIVMVDCVKKKASVRADVVRMELLRRKGAGLRAIAFFGHGWPSGIQFGYNLKNCDSLASLISGCSLADVKIGLFACLAAENSVRDVERKKIGPATDGGFADRLRDSLVRNGIEKGWVDAHKTAGHTTWNPYVVRFLCEDVVDPEYGAVGGGWIVEPGSKYWKEWVAALRNNFDGLRWGYLFEEELHIKQRLDGKEHLMSFSPHFIK